MSCCLSIQGRIHVGEWGLRVITVRICSKGLPCGANGLPRGWLGSANVLPRDCLWIAWGLLRDPEIGPGIGKGLLCDYLGDAFGLPRDCSGIGKGLPWDCRGITERLPGNCLAITEGLLPGLAKELLMANGLPVDCLRMQGCRRGIAQGYPWDCQ